MHPVIVVPWGSPTFGLGSYLSKEHICTSCLKKEWRGWTVSAGAIGYLKAENMVSIFLMPSSSAISKLQWFRITAKLLHGSLREVIEQPAPGKEITLCCLVIVVLSYFAFVGKLKGTIRGLPWRRGSRWQRIGKLLIVCCTLAVDTLELQE